VETSAGQLDICLKPRLKSLGIEIIKCFPCPLFKNLPNEYFVLFYDQREVVVDASRKDGIKRASFSCSLVLSQETLKNKR